MISSLKLSRGAKKFWIGWSVFVILMLLVVVKGQLFSPVTFPVHFNLQIGIDKLMLAVQSVAVYVIFFADSYSKSTCVANHVFFSLCGSITLFKLFRLFLEAV